MTPRVSIIMTVRNGADYLPATIAALRAQTFEDYEVVINDNGSTDATPAILAAYAAQDARVRFVDVRDGGANTFTSGISRAFANAKGYYVAVNDADDISHPDRLAKQAALLDARPEVALVGSWYDYIDESGRVTGEIRVPADHGGLVDACQSRNPIAHSSVMFRREAALAAGGYQERFTYASDFRLQVGLIAQGGRVAAIPESLVQIRLHAAQTSLMPGRKAQLYREPLEVLRLASALPGVSPRARLAGMMARQKMALRYGLALWQGGRRLEGVAGAARWLAASLTSLPLPVGVAGRRMGARETR